MSSLEAQIRSLLATATVFNPLPRFFALPLMMTAWSLALAPAHRGLAKERRYATIGLVALSLLLPNLAGGLFPVLLFFWGFVVMLASVFSLRRMEADQARRSRQAGGDPVAGAIAAHQAAQPAAADRRSFSRIRDAGDRTPQGASPRREDFVDPKKGGRS